MNTKIFLTGILPTVFSLNVTNLLAEGLTLPAGDVGIEDRIGGSAPPEPTAEEIAEPPAGEIQRLYLRNVNEARSGLASLLGAVTEGPDGKQSPFYSKLQTIKSGLDELAVSRLETQLFSLIPLLAEIHQAEPGGVPDFVGDASGWLQQLSPPFLYTIARHIVRKNSQVAIEELTKFMEVFSAGRGLFSEADWEEESPPINAAGVMILDAATVVSRLKTGAWQSAKQFVGGADEPTAFFIRYLDSGEGLVPLKTKYAQNTAAIHAKFVELKEWIAQQEAAAGSQ